MTHTVYRFGECELDVAARTLLRSGEVTRVTPKSFDCLVYLLSERERAVGRDELISAVWGRVEVSDAVLGQTLRRARLAIGDTGNRQKYIRTVPRHGYHWVAPVEEVQHDASNIPVGSVGASQEPEHSESRPSPPDNRWRRRAALLSVAGALLSLAVLAWYWYPRPVAAPAAQPSGDQNISLVAVMPVEVEAGNGDVSWIRLGVMDFVASRLRADIGLDVVPSSQMMALVGAVDIEGAEAAEQLRRRAGAQWLVRMRAQRIDDSWQLSIKVLGAPAIADLQVSETEVLDAATAASAELLAAMSGSSDGLGIPATQLPIAERLQRIDAAMLGGKLDSALTLVESVPAEQRESSALQVRVGRLAFRRGHVGEAEQIYARLVRQKEQLTAAQLAISYMGLGAVAVRRGQMQAAQQNYGDALAVLGGQGDPNLIGQAYTGRGVAYAAQNEYEKAEQDLGRAKIFLQRTGNALETATVDVNLGLLASRQQHYARAIAHFDHAIDTFQRDRVHDNLAAALLGKTRVQLELLEFRGAAESSGRAWQLAESLDNAILVGQIGTVHANVLMDQGQLQNAEQVVASLRPTPRNRAEITAIRARLAEYRGERERVMALLAPDGTFDWESMPQALPVFSRTVLREGQTARLAEVLQRIGPDVDADPGARISLALARGWLAEASENEAIAAGYFQDAESVARRSGIPALVVRANTAQARYLLRVGRLGKATAVIGELEPYSNRVLSVASVTAALYRRLGEPRLAAMAEATAKSLAGERESPQELSY